MMLALFYQILERLGMSPIQATCTLLGAGVAVLIMWAWRKSGPDKMDDQHLAKAREHLEAAAEELAHVKAFAATVTETASALAVLHMILGDAEVCSRFSGSSKLRQYRNN